MKTSSFSHSILMGISMFIIVAMYSCTTKQTAFNPPVADKIAKELTMHGDTRIDNYYWMRLSDEQKNAEDPDEQTQKVLEYLGSERDYLMRHCPLDSTVMIKILHIPV